MLERGRSTVIRNVFAAVMVSAALAAGAVAAQTSADKATIDAAKMQGVVGEQGDGFLGLVKGGGAPAVISAMQQINTGRAAAYQDTAARTGVTASAAGQATAVQLHARLRTGEWYRPLNGGWVRR
jgi:uncharacterized protein YdbL (DUF1318 family)